MTVTINKESNEMDIKVNKLEQVKLYNRGWLYDHNQKILIIVDEENTMSVFQNVDKMVVNCWTVTLEK